MTNTAIPKPALDPVPALISAQPDSENRCSQVVSKLTTLRRRTGGSRVLPEAVSCGVERRPAHWSAPDHLVGAQDVDFALPTLEQCRVESG
jgi:hypothetical protein